VVLTDNRGYYCPSGSRKFRAAYKQALSLEQKTILELNTLLGDLASWVVATDALRDESPPAIVTLQQLRELSHAWAIARDSVRAALVSLTSEPTQVVLPLCLTGRPAAPICDEAMDGEPCMPFVILHIPLIYVQSEYLFVCWFGVSIEETTSIRIFLGLSRSYGSKSFFHVCD